MRVRVIVWNMLQRLLMPERLYKKQKRNRVSRSRSLRRKGVLEESYLNEIYRLTRRASEGSTEEYDRSIKRLQVWSRIYVYPIDTRS